MGRERVGVSASRVGPGDEVTIEGANFSGTRVKIRIVYRLPEGSDLPDSRTELMTARVADDTADTNGAAGDISYTVMAYPPPASEQMWTASVAILDLAETKVLGECAFEVFNRG